MMQQIYMTFWPLDFLAHRFFGFAQILFRFFWNADLYDKVDLYDFSAHRFFGFAQIF
jgi:hypothetical protein